MEKKKVANTPKKTQKRKSKTAPNKPMTERMEKDADSYFQGKIDLTPAPGESETDALRHAIVECRARGWTARDIAKAIDKSERYVWELIDQEMTAIDRKMTTKDEYRKNAIRRTEMLIQKYHSIAVKDRLVHTKFDNFGNAFIDDNALDVQFEAVKVLMSLEDRLSKFIGYNTPEEEKGAQLTKDDMHKFMASEGVQRIIEMKQVMSGKVDKALIELEPLPEYEASKSDQIND